MHVSGRNDSLFSCLTVCFYREPKQILSNENLRKIFSYYSGNPLVLKQLNKFWTKRIEKIVTQLSDANNGLIAASLPNDVFNIIFSKLGHQLGTLACVNSYWYKKVVIYCQHVLKDEMDIFPNFLNNIDKGMTDDKSISGKFINSADKHLFDADVVEARSLSRIRLVFGRFKKSILNGMTQNHLPLINKGLDSAIFPNIKELLVYLRSLFKFNTGEFSDQEQIRFIEELIDTNQVREILEVSNRMGVFEGRSCLFLLFGFLLEKEKYRTALKILEIMQKKSKEAFEATGQSRYLVNLNPQFKDLYNKSLEKGYFEVALQSITRSKDICLRKKFHQITYNEKWKALACEEKIRIIKKLDSSEDREYLYCRAVKNYIEMNQFDEAMEMVQLMENNEEKERLLNSIIAGFAQLERGDKVRKAYALHTDCIAPHPIICAIFSLFFKRD